MSDPVLVAEGLGKTYPLPKGDLRVFEGLDSEPRRGELAAIMGASGVGKTTLLNLLGGLDRPTEGRVLLDGTDLFGGTDRDVAAVRNRKIGFVFQVYHLLPEFTALEDVSFPRNRRSFSYDSAAATSWSPRRIVSVRMTLGGSASANAIVSPRTIAGTGIAGAGLAGSVPRGAGERPAGDPDRRDERPAQHPLHEPPVGRDRLDAGERLQVALRVAEVADRRDDPAALDEEGAHRPAEYGALRVHLPLLDEPVRADLFQARQPLGAILNAHGGAYRGCPGAFFRIFSNDLINDSLQLVRSQWLYGRCNCLADRAGRTIAEVIEILPPEDESQRSDWSSG